MSDTPHVQRLLSRLVALTFGVAFLSLGAQIHVLIGSRGLLPVAALAERLPPDTPFSRAPSVFLHSSYTGDLTLTFGVAVGVLLSVVALLGLLPRICLALATLLYLSFAVACQDFLAFQWDNLLLECGLLGAFLPRERRSAWVLFLFRVLLFKLYFESGIAKWQSHLEDWHDGSAMTFYYETAPLPTRLAWYAHHLPARWHHVESWGTLLFELGGPLLIFGSRRMRLAAGAVFTAFQLVNIATANYGFFSYLALLLHVVLLDDADVPRLRRALRITLARLRRAVVRVLPRRTDKPLRRLRARFRLSFRSTPTPTTTNPDTGAFLSRLSVAAVVTAVYLGVSLDRAQASFFRESPRSETLSALSRTLQPYRLVNTYHLFGHITRERIEPTFGTFDGSTWTDHDLRYKPGDPKRAPPFVAPHHPRVDFSLWFYGLSHQRGVPAYVRALVTALCRDPSSIQGLFAGPLPAAARAARITFHDYHFTTFAERWGGPHAGAYWKRTESAPPQVVPCAR